MFLELHVGVVLRDAKGPLDVFEVFKKVRHGGQLIIDVEQVAADGAGIVVLQLEALDHESGLEL